MDFNPQIPGFQFQNPWLFKAIDYLLGTQLILYIL